MGWASSIYWWAQGVRKSRVSLRNSEAAPFKLQSWEMLNFLKKGQSRIRGSGSTSTHRSVGLSSAELFSSHSNMKACAGFDEFKSTHTGLDLLWVATLLFPQVGLCGSPDKEDSGCGDRICGWVRLLYRQLPPLVGNFVGEPPWDQDKRDSSIFSRSPSPIQNTFK